MANEIGSTLLNSLTRSTFDIGGMSKALAEAGVAGPKAILERNQEKVSTELDALKYLKTNLEAFNTYVTDLSSPALFGQKNATSSNESVVSVTASSTAALASYQIESKQLAQAHTFVANKSFSSPSDLLSTGDLTIQVGGQTHTLTVDATNNTLEGLQKVINGGDYGVTASIINNGGSYQMMFTSKETGAAGAATVSGLADFDVDGMTTTAAAQDAVMVLNGLTISSATNTFDKIIDGVSFQLNSASPGVQQTASVGQNTQGVKDTITNFVDVYNQLNTILDELGSYDSGDLTAAERESPEYEYYGDLAGSSLLRSVKSQLRETLSGALQGLTGGVSSLSDVGLSFDREGVLQLDSTKLDSLLATDMQSLSTLFAKGGSSDDPMVNVLGGSDKTLAGDYTLNITQVAQQAVVLGGAVAGPTIDLAADASFNVSVNGSTASAITIPAGSYTTDQMAQMMASFINGNSDVKAAGGEVSVRYDGTQLAVTSTRFGASSSVELSGFSGFAAAGFADASVHSAVGQNLAGTVDTADGQSQSIGIYVDPQDGRKVKISDFAGVEAVRGLEFEVLGGATGARGTMTFSQGFASQLEQTINNLFEKDGGLISQRIGGLNDRLEHYSDKAKDIDVRYERLLMKYQMQFSALQSLMTSSQQTRDYLSAAFSNNNNN